MSSMKKLSMLLLFGGMLVINPFSAAAQDEAPAEESASSGSSDSSEWTTWLGAGGNFYEADEENEAGALYELRLENRTSDSLSWELGIGGSPFLEGNNYNAPDPREGSFNGKNSPGENWVVKSNVGALYHMGARGEALDPYLSFIVGMEYYGKRREDGQWAPFGGPGFGVSYWLSDSLAIRGDYNVVLAKDEDPEINHHVLAMIHYSWGSGDQGGDNAGGGDDELGGKSTGPLKPIYFDFDKSNISGQAQQTLKENADWLSKNPDKKVSLEGHCDERGTNEYNMALGQRRAKSTLDYMRTLGVPADRMSTTTYGEEVPADPGHNEAAWSKNRRCESVIKK